MQVVEGSSKNIEVAVVEKDTGLRFLTDAEVDELVSRRHTTRVFDALVCASNARLLLDLAGCELALNAVALTPPSLELK